jgi:opacity protein-like surface antigen
MDGSIEKNGHSLPVSTSLHDSVDLVKDHLDIALAGHLEATRGDWSIFLDVNYQKFSGEGSASKSVLDGIGAASADVSVDLTMTFAEFGAAWRAGTFQTTGGASMPIEILGGLRWNSMDTSADIDVSVASAEARFDREYDPSFTTDWVDPFIGARTMVPLADNVGLLLRADIGGGGFGSGSDVVWNVIAGFIVKINECTDLFAGYRWYDFERDIDGRSTQMQMEGPGIGLAIRF